MQKTVKYLVVILSAIFLESCNDGVTLQRYFVDHQESNNFTSIDLPATILSLDETTLNKNQKEAYRSIKRLNFLGYKANQSDMAVYSSELTKVSDILKSNKYKDLVEFNDKGKKIVVKYIGNEVEADEVIVFGSSKEIGFGIVRILGNHMNPDKIVTLMDAMKNSNMDASQFEGILNFFK